MAHLERDDVCYLPLSALVETSQCMSIYVIEGKNDIDNTNAHADSITLNPHDIKKQQGIYKCSSTEHCFVSLKVRNEPVQV
jgi:hypothetical protein